MKNGIQLFWIILLIALAFGAGIWLTRKFYFQIETKTEENSQVLLEQIKKVAKLVTVEGYLSEIYDYKDYYGYDISMFRKKALLRVRAKVSVGYDLSNLQIDTYADEKKLVIGNLPDPEILSIDHEVDYYDMQQGTFNAFTEADLTRLQQNAKNFIREKANSSELFESAVEQGNEMLQLIEFIAESAGWTVEYRTVFEQEEMRADSLRN